MRKRIRLTESDIKRLVMTALMESLKYNENVKDKNGSVVTNPKILAVGWRDAVLDKMNGGYGVAKYGGKEYTIADWSVSLQGSPIFSQYGEEKITNAIGAVISEFSKEEVKSFLNRVHDMGIKSVQEFKTNPDLRNNEYVQNLLHQANENIQPDPEVKYGFYSEFFYDTDMKTSLLYTAEDIARQVENKEPQDIINIILKYLHTYAINKFRDWFRHKGGRVSTTTGNVSLSRPVTNEKDIDYYGGESFINSEAESSTMDSSALSPADTIANSNSDKAIDPLKKIKYMFGLILSGRIKVKRTKKSKDPITGEKTLVDTMVDASDFVLNKAGQTSRAKWAVKYVYDHFWEIFNRDDIKREFELRTANRKQNSYDRQKSMEYTALLDYIKKRISRFLYNAYQRAYEANDKNDYIVNLFKQEEGKPVIPKTPEDFKSDRDPVKYMWSLIRCTEDGTSPFAFGDELQAAFEDDLDAELVSESRKRKPIRLSERKLKRIISESVNKILNRYY